MRARALTQRSLEPFNDTCDRALEMRRLMSSDLSGQLRVQRTVQERAFVSDDDLMGTVHASRSGSRRMARLSDDTPTRRVVREDTGRGFFVVYQCNHK